MRADDRFDDLVATNALLRPGPLDSGMLELGLFERLRVTPPPGLTAAELAAFTNLDEAAVEAWAWAAEIHDLIATDPGGRSTIDEDTAAILLDDDRPEFLGGQVRHAIVSTLDWDRMADRFRTGEIVKERPARYREAIERLTVQDIAVFFQEGLAQLPELTATLSRGARVLDVACGGGKWLISVARRFPNTELVGVEFEPDSVARAMRHVSEAGLGQRIRIEPRPIPDMPFREQFDLVYIQDALHELPDPVASLRAAWAAVAPGGRIVVLEWCLPEEPEGASVHDQLLWGIQIDELYQGTRMYTHDGFIELFQSAGVPAPSVIDLLSGSTLFVVERPA